MLSGRQLAVYFSFKSGHRQPKLTIRGGLFSLFSERSANLPLSRTGHRAGGLWRDTLDENGLGRDMGGTLTRPNPFSCTPPLCVRVQGDQERPGASSPAHRPLH